MTETKKLFYLNAYMQEFEALVLSCQEYEDGFQVVLDQTAFFPEGGGQYGDTGWLGESRVADTVEQGGVVYHLTNHALPVGSTVHGCIDWDERFSRMQQHTGEHIVSGIIHRRFGYDNVGFHLGADYCTMDFNGTITMEQLRVIENEANRAANSDLDVRTLYPDKKELAKMDYRSKIEIEGLVRIIEIPDVDLCACCAPHVARTGEVGLIKLVGMENYKGGERIYLLCGDRALRDYQIKQENASLIGSLLCEKENQIAEAVKRLRISERAAKLDVVRLERELLRYKAKETQVDEGVTLIFEQDLSGDAPRELMNLLLDRGAEVCAVFSGTEKLGYRYVIGSRTEDVRDLNQKLKEAFGARGGGKPEMVQGSLKGSRKEIKKFIKDSISV